MRSLEKFKCLTFHIFNMPKKIPLLAIGIALLTIAIIGGVYTGMLISKSTPTPSTPQPSPQSTPTPQPSIEQKFPITIHVLDDATNNPIENADVIIDESYQGKTDSQGTYKISEVKIGDHKIEVKTKSDDKTQFITVNSAQTIEIKVKVPINVLLKLTDKYSQNPISRIFDERPIRLEVNNQDYGELNSDGTKLIEGLNPKQQYQLSLNIPQYSQGYFPVGYLSVPSSDYNYIVDMPSPYLTITLKCTPDALHLKYDCVVSAINSGNIKTYSTYFIVLESCKNNNTYQISESVGRGVGSIESGKSFTATLTLGNKCWGGEKEWEVYALDGYQYLSQTKIQQEISVPPGIFQKLINYCEQNTDKCIDIGTKIVSGVIKIIGYAVG